MRYGFSVYVLVIIVTSIIKCNSLTPRPVPLLPNSTCTCVNDVIDCSHRYLLSLERFTFHTNQNEFTTLDVSNNQISSLAPGAFSPLEISHLNLSWNQLTHIDGYVFDGIQRFLKVLDVSHNQLQTLPDLSQCVGVLVLHVHDNPIDGSLQAGVHHTTDEGFTDNVMRTLGRTLQEFKFGHETRLEHWPKTIDHLLRLQTLIIDGLNMDHVYGPSFKGLEYSLTSLTIHRTKLQMIPNDIQRLRLLQTLELNHNVPTIDLGNHVISEEPFRSINTTLTTLAFTYDNLTEFPTILRFLGNLRNLSLAGNPLKTISDEAVELLVHTQVEFLSLAHCQLTRVPSSLASVHSLRSLDLSNNRLLSIDTGELASLTGLRVLNLRGNPLRTISRDAFAGMDNLSVLDLSFTNLTDVPKALQNLSGLRTLLLKGILVDCTCNLVWVRNWLTLFGKADLEIDGECGTINQSLHDYIFYRLLRCPAYIEFIG